MDVPTYARVKNRQIIQYPVYEEHINLNNNPDLVFLLCKYSAKPEVPLWHYAKEVFTAYDDFVWVTYTIRPMKLETLFQILAKTSPTDENFLSLVTAIEKGCIDRIQLRLDNFAATRLYGDETTGPMNAVCNYALSNIPKFAAEAAYCIDAVGATWKALYVYWGTTQAAFMAGTGSLPTSYAEIEACLPELAWPADIPELY